MRAMAQQGEPRQQPRHEGWLTLTEAARRTRRQLATIRRWIERGELVQPTEAYRLPAFQRETPEWRIDPAALDRVHTAHVARAIRGQPHAADATVPVPAVAVPVPAAAVAANTSGDPSLLVALLAELQHLRDEVAALKHLAGERGHRPASVSIPATADTRAETPFTLPVPPPHLPPQLARSAPSTTPLVPLDGWRGGQGRVRGLNGGNGAPFPAGWVSFSGWSRNHGLEMRTVERHISKGRLPMPHVAPKNQPWIHHGYQIVRAYDPEQHQRACEAAAHFWPDVFIPSCGPECPFVAPHTTTTLAAPTATDPTRGEAAPVSAEAAGVGASANDA